MPIFVAEVHINDFIELRMSMVKNSVISKFKERASMNDCDAVPGFLFTETVHKLESSIEEGCAAIHYLLL